MQVQSTVCLDLVPAIYESKLSLVAGTTSKRTSEMCYTFQKEKKTPNLWSRKKGEAQKMTIRTRILANTDYYNLRTLRTNRTEWGKVKSIKSNESVEMTTEHTNHTEVSLSQGRPVVISALTTGRIPQTPCPIKTTNWTNQHE